jgi:hypothetical protein
MASVIPFGQPVQYDHHSTRRDLNYRARIDATFDRGFRQLNEAESLERRAEMAALNDAISSDDPEAVVRLRQKLAEEEAEHSQIKAANAVLKKGGAVADAAALLTNQRDPARHIEAWRSMGQWLLPTTNVTARIRATKKRLSTLEAKAKAPTRAAEQVGDASISESDNRVQIRFPGKPAADVRDRLKRSGFRWSPSASAWQRHASEQAWHAARSILAQPAAAQAEQ